MQEFENLGIPCLALSLESLSRFEKILAKRRLKAWLAMHEVTSVHAQHFSVYSDVQGPANAARVQFQVVAEHTAHYLLANRQYARITRKLATRASVIVAINEVVRNAICNVSGLLQDRITIIENGIDTSRFSPAVKEQKDYCQLVWLGRLHPDKDVLTALKAFREALTVHSGDLRLRIIGDGEQRLLAENFIHEHGLSNHVSLVGEQADPAASLPDSDVFLMSSVTEGTPLAMLEALSCGLPVVSTAVGGIPDVISDDVGILAPSGDWLALARGILSLAENPELRTYMSANARQLAERRFSESTMAASYIALIEQRVNETTR